MRVLLFVLYLVSSYATFTNCLLGASPLPVIHLSADPPDRVASNQLVTFSIQFILPPDTYIPKAEIAIVTTVNSFPLPIQTIDFPFPLIDPKQHSLNHTMTFPFGVWGYVRSDIILYNASGAKLVCARWNVFATNTLQNESSWLL